ncbi:transposable element Tcb1 transposase isoform X1 [Phycodurus eques]|uniref:transposable element Tcb1 transposase isoform X1 n=1 Tax=Phycodurus eques TaxID=693459 RepID=UPI002ACEF5D4|nr:transposable element Tcb1 transposase isoform X1 [Phycodurus eques]
MKSRELSVELRDKIVSSHRSGEGYRKISAALKVPMSTVGSVIRKWKTFGTTRTLPRSGRPTKPSHQGTKEDVVNPTVAPSELQGSSADREASRKTSISAAIRRSGVYVARRKPLLGKRHMAARLEFAQRHLKEPQTVRDRIIWSGETKIELFGANGRCQPGSARYPANSIPTVNDDDGSGVTMWGCFSAAGTGRLVRIEEKWNAEVYRDILDANLFQSALELRLGREFVFQQDNNRQHKAKITQKWLEDNCVNVLEWPSKSPDLNPIEHLWRDVKMAVRRQSPSSLMELECFCKEEWVKLPKDRCAQLVASYSKRLTAVVAAEGALTEY